MKMRGLGSIYLRGNVWRLKYSFRGRCIRESSHSPVRSDAVKLLRRRQGEMAKGRLIGPDAERVAFEDLSAMLLDDYRMNGRKSLFRAEASLKHLERFFRGAKAVDITPDRVNAYIAARLQAGAKPATIQKERSALVRMFTLGESAGKIPKAPRFPSIEVRNVRTGFFEEPDIRAVLQHLPDHLQRVVQFAYFTGWRKSEILSLQWRQIDFVAGTIRLEPGSTKNDEGRMFPFADDPELAKLLSRQREETLALERQAGRIIPWVFHRAGQPIRYFRRSWLAACRAAGVPGKLFHDLRRTAVRNLERESVPRSWAMKLTGHKTESVYRRYAIVSERDLRDSVQRLAAARTGTISGTVGGRRSVKWGG